MSTVTTRRTCDVPEAAREFGVSPWMAYEEIRRTGKLAGITPIRVGKRILISRAAVEAVLAGESTSTDSESNEVA